jgi:hypothetical protein
MRCADNEMSSGADSDPAPVEPGADNLAGSENIKLLSTETFTIAAATQQNEQCCMMHSQPWSNSALRLFLLNNSAYQIAAANSPIPVAVTFQSLTAIVVHDHGPPGIASPRYVLNSTFRI